MTFGSASQEARTRLRQAHGVRLVRGPEEGCAAGQLPAGVYGYTGAPVLASPLFADPRYRNFEVHHTAAGEIVLIGFVRAADAARLGDAQAVAHVTAYPDLEGDANTIVAIPYPRIVQHRQYSIRNSPGITLEVRPAAQPAVV